MGVEPAVETNRCSSRSATLRTAASLTSNTSQASRSSGPRSPSNPIRFEERNKTRREGLRFVNERRRGPGPMSYVTTYAVEQGQVALAERECLGQGRSESPDIPLSVPPRPLLVARPARTTERCSFLRRSRKRSELRDSVCAPVRGRCARLSLEPIVMSRSRPPAIPMRRVRVRRSSDSQSSTTRTSELWVRLAVKVRDPLSYKTKGPGRQAPGHQSRRIESASRRRGGSYQLRCRRTHGARPAHPAPRRALRIALIISTRAESAWNSMFFKLGSFPDVKPDNSSEWKPSAVREHR